MLDIFYARKSSDKQREDSIADQDRRARELLPQYGLDPAGFILMADLDESGLLDSRPEFDRIQELIRQGRVRTLAVIHQDRFSRSATAVGMIQDLVFKRGRFLSLEEHIDSNVEGWEVQVGFRAVMNHEFIKNLRRRSREGMIGRLLDGNGSVGDFPYGYRSVPIESPDPKRRRRPKTVVVIDDPAAALVLKIFILFADENYSYAAICRWIDEHRGEYAPLPTKGPMYTAYIKEILKNKKYIGIWRWGESRTIRDSKGNKQVIEVSEEEVEVVDRPDLRIIPQDLWDRKETKLAKLKDIHGMREGHRKRGPREYYRLLYAKKLLPGLTFCGECDSQMLEYTSIDKRLNCKGYRQRRCSNNVTLPYARAEAAVLREIDRLLKADAEWISTVVGKTKEIIRQKHAEAGADQAKAAEALQDTQRRLDRVADEIELRGGSQTLAARLKQLEDQKQRQLLAIQELENLEQAERSLPDENWFARELNNLASLLQQEMAAVAHKLRPLIKKIVAEPVRFQHRKRGCYRLHITLDIGAGLMPALKAQFPAVVAEAVAVAMAAETTVTVDLFDAGMATDAKLEAAFEMRRQGRRWTEISKITGVSVPQLMYYWHRVGRDKKP